LWTTWLTDPDGYRIELVRWPLRHADELTRADFPGQAPPSVSADVLLDAASAGGADR